MVPVRTGVRLIYVKTPGGRVLRMEGGHFNQPENAMQTVTATDRLMKDLRVVVGDAEELLKATASQTGERVQQVRAKAEESLRGVRARLQEAGEDVNARAREAASEVNDQVREHPWTAVGVAAGIGLIVGILLGRK